MPTYDYICGACGHALELFQSMSEAPKRKCPECGELKLKRQIGMGAGVLFKGSGFYQTDYRPDSYHKAKKADTEPASSEPTKDKSKSKDKSKAEKPKGDAGSGTSK